MDPKGDHDENEGGARVRRDAAAVRMRGFMSNADEAEQMRLARICPAGYLQSEAKERGF